MLLPMVILLFLAAAVAQESFASQKGDVKAGQKTYNTFCTACHGTSGRGDGQAAVALPVKPADHTDGKHMKALKDDYLFKIIKEGGAAVGKSQLMPAWGAQLKDQDIQNLLAYIRSLAKSSK